MNIEVWTEPEPKKDEPTRVKLFQDSDGAALCVVDAGGHRLHNGRIAILDKQGLHRCKNLDPKHGFSLLGGLIVDC